MRRLAGAEGAGKPPVDRRAPRALVVPYSTAMANDLDVRCAAFWRWFASHEAKLRADFLAAAERKDYPALQALVEQVSGALAPVSAGLSVRLNGGPPGFQLAILSPEPAIHAIAKRILAGAPALAHWTFGEEVVSPAANIIVRDAEGRELVISYGDVTFVILPAKPDGSQSVLFTIAEDFDPRGERGHLYQAAAAEIIKNAFGAPPPGMASYALIPARMIEPRPTALVSELAAAWRARTA